MIDQSGGGSPRVPTALDIPERRRVELADPGGPELRKLRSSVLSIDVWSLGNSATQAEQIGKMPAEPGTQALLGSRRSTPDG